jgi:cytochrome d ubiquinol oxidase subunit II
MSLEVLVAGFLVAALTIYALLGGADYGGGVWDLFAVGKRAKEQRDLIAHAIGPIWEANHVWLVLALVILFTAFSGAFAAISTALHIPLTIMLAGIVLRGATFTFRSYDSKKDSVQTRWSLIFSVSSVVTPIFLGIIVGAIASGKIIYENGILKTGFFNSWFAVFPFAVGIFTLVLFAFLAAVYLTIEAENEELQDDFRYRALFSGILLGGLALAVFLLAKDGAPRIYDGLWASRYSLPLHALTAIFAVGALIALWKRKYYSARIFAAGQVVFIIWGWAVSQFPFMVEPNITIQSAAAPQLTLQLLAGLLIVGSIFLFPVIYYLFRIFKGSVVLPKKRNNV